MIKELPLPMTGEGLRSVARALARQGDPGRAIVAALVMQAAFHEIAGHAGEDDKRGFADRASEYMAGVADAIEAMTFGSPQSRTIH